MTNQWPARLAGRLGVVCLMTLALGWAVPCSARALAPAARRPQVGIASWYGPGHEGHRTASGERFDMHRLTAAHRTLPLGTRLRVTNLANGRSVVVRLTDRGPYVPGRSIDLSYAAGRAIGMIGRGLTRVRIEPLAARATRQWGSPHLHGQTER